MIQLLAYDYVDGRVFFQDAGQIYFGCLPFEMLDKYKLPAAPHEYKAAVATMDYVMPDEAHERFASIPALIVFLRSEYVRVNKELGRPVDNTTEADVAIYVKDLNKQRLEEFANRVMQELKHAAPKNDIGTLIGYMLKNPQINALPEIRSKLLLVLQETKKATKAQRPLRASNQPRKRQKPPGL